MLRIKLLRLSLGKSQWEVAKEGSLSQGRYSMIERGLIEPTKVERERFAQVLQVPASTLFRSAVRLRRSSSQEGVTSA